MTERRAGALAAGSRRPVGLSGGVVPPQPAAIARQAAATRVVVRRFNVNGPSGIGFRVVKGIAGCKDETHRPISRVESPWSCFTRLRAGTLQGSSLYRPQNGKVSSSGSLVDSSVRNAASALHDQVGHAARPFSAVAGRGSPALGVCRQQVPGTGHGHPAAVDGFERGRAVEPALAWSIATSAGKWARPMLVSISPAWSPASS